MDGCVCVVILNVKEVASLIRARETSCKLSNHSNFIHVIDGREEPLRRYFKDVYQAFINFWIENLGPRRLLFGVSVDE